jgi:hypothetical protein
VNIDRHGAWKFHDYARVRSTASPSAGALARPSGQLMPLLGPASAGASRPRFERWEGLREAWIANLRAAGVSYLFASALSAYEIDYSWHDEGGFPIEAEWARRDPAVFRLIYENGQVRLYALSSP